MSSTVSCEVEGGIAQVRLDRPDKLNALTLDTLEGLVATARRLGRDRTLRGVVLGGAGDSFCAGLDFATVLANPPRVARAFVPNPFRGTNLFQEACWAWRRLPVPVVAAVHGHCYGGGLQIALAADLRMTTADAQWSVLEAKWGLIPDMSGIQALSQLVTHRRRQAPDDDGRGRQRHPGGRAGAGERGPRRARSSRRPASSRRSRPARPTPWPPRSASSSGPGPRATGAPSPASASSRPASSPRATRPIAREAAMKRVAPVFDPRRR